MNNKYKELYDFCQTLACPPHISRNTICDKAQDIMGLKVKIQKRGLNAKIIRGLYLSGSSGSRFTEQINGNALIIIARGLTDDWDRLVQVKEMMHIFDEDDETISSTADLEELLNSILVPNLNATKKISSEFNAVYMALACFCPETVRLQFIEDCKKGHTDEYEIALRLRLPQHYVRILLSPGFVEQISKIIN